jgi:hypothetical protein
MGFEYNQGHNYVPCIITNHLGQQTPATFVCIAMGADPQVIGRMRGSIEDYGRPLLAEPRFEQARRPHYTVDEWWKFKASAEGADEMDGALAQLHD